MSINKVLRAEGYNLRERANIYAGAALGFVFPIALTKYFISSGMGYEKNLQTELIEWGASLVADVAVSLLCRGAPLVHSTIGGALIGGLSAESLRRARGGEEGLLKRMFPIERLTK